ncbi:hypothetical protein TUM15745_09420 [Neisseria gonorrhoeae]|nr:hypothetical protein ESCNG_20190 [Neisseria gonorrhoeae]SCW17050.1 hypothetical protein ESCNG_40069 [Neisseria gonorrhoeae]SCW17979.1 hypothetical protein ESCNG_430006 [Neisseria gonorrhoeae]GFK99124.1 hypothetical protein TUM15745_09420 [Neisseria gonorrhoeae]GFL13917.1 hypothetical protein TUM15752_13280 [Neisseria gonorrhoeae]
MRYESLRFALGCAGNVDGCVCRRAGKGCGGQDAPRKIAATALVFGTVEAFMPLAGWVGGFYAKPFISE